LVYEILQYELNNCGDVSLCSCSYILENGTVEDVEEVEEDEEGDDGEDGEDLTLHFERVISVK